MSFGRSAAAEKMKSIIRERYSKLPREDAGYTALTFGMTDDVSIIRGTATLSTFLGR